MRGVLRAAFITGVLLLSARTTAASPGSFVYVTASTCDGFSICTANLLVYDARTAALVTTIPVAFGRNAAAGGLAISPDGSRLYLWVSAGASDAVLVIDATRHQQIGVFGVAMPGALAVSHDGKLLFDANGALQIFDIGTQQLIKSIPPISGAVTALAADPAQDRVYWIESAGGSCVGTEVRGYDMAAGNTVAVGSAASPALGWTHVFVSRDDSRLYLSAYGALCGLHPAAEVQVIDPASLTVTKDVAVTGVLGSVDSLARNRVYMWDEFATLRVLDRDTFAPVGQQTIVGVSSMAVTADEAHGYITSTNALNVLNLATNTVDRTIAIPGLSGSVVATPPNPAANVCSYRIDTAQSSWTISGGTTSIGLKTSCAWSASSDSSWARVVASSGTGDATLSLTVDPNLAATNRTATVSIGGQIVSVTQAGSSSTAPFGTIDTPADNSSGLNGAIAISGWALDDVGVTRVRIYRDPVSGEPAVQQVFIGNATLVDGARPDVQNAYPGLPFASRAGWGLQILTNMFPNGGNGQFRLYAYADDVDGHTALLGFRTITADNATAALPFGTIDTPGQGDTVSGAFVNFGWVLSSALIATDGSTIDVLVDGVSSGHPVYNNFRSDIASLFPSLPNSNGAIGYFVLDTTTLANGLHSIAWVVRDSAGHTQGIGSRFFTVAN